MTTQLDSRDAKIERGKAEFTIVSDDFNYYADVLAVYDDGKPYITWPTVDHAFEDWVDIERGRQMVEEAKIWAREL